jgi:DNA-binding PucR family transcriptional regulator
VPDECRVRSLLLRLSALDADAEAAVRVIAYFDALAVERATLPALVRSAAALAECPAGFRPGTGDTLRFGPDGVPVPDGTPVAESGAVDLGPAGRVWLERPGEARALDDLVLERFALGARLLARASRRTVVPDLADPALVELLIAEREAEEDRARALRLLGLDAALPVRLLAVAADGRDAGAEAVALMARGRGPRAVRVAVLGDAAALVLQPRAGAAALVDDLRASLADRVAERGGDASALRVGVGGAVPGLEARASWLQARLALRFAVPGAGEEALVEHAALGSLALLAELPPERLLAEPDVAALEALAATAGGALDVAALEAFCRTGSLRQAAAVLHLHHSSVAGRLAHVEDALGWRLDDPQGRLRARVALLARRLAVQR